MKKAKAQNLKKKTDSFSQFLRALYEDYDLDKAIQLIDQIAIEANDDFLLRKYVFDIKKQAYLLIFQIKCKLYRTIERSEIEKYLLP